MPAWFLRSWDLIWKHAGEYMRECTCHCCESALRWCGSGPASGCLVHADPVFCFGADPEPACHFDADPDPALHFYVNPAFSYLNPDPPQSDVNLQHRPSDSPRLHCESPRLQSEPYRLHCEPSQILAVHFDANPDLIRPITFTFGARLRIPTVQRAHIQREKGSGQCHCLSWREKGGNTQTRRQQKTLSSFFWEKVCLFDWRGRKKNIKRSHDSD